jgi:FkbH-like protein
MSTNNNLFSWTAAIPDVGDLKSEALITLRHQLRTYSLKGFELEMLGRLLRNVVLCDESVFPVLRVAIVSGCTTEPVANALRVALLTIGYRAEIYEAPFGVYRQEILNPGSGLYAFEPQIILIISPTEDIVCIPRQQLSQSEVDLALASEVTLWKSIWADIKKHSSALILQHVFETQESVMLGLAESRSSWTPSRFVTQLNYRLLEESAGSVYWIDIENLANLVGRNNWNDPRLKYHGKFAFSVKYLSEYAKLLEGVLRSALGLSRKALIVDLDNTLWGGVIGDDGLEGIQLGPSSPEGEAYFAFCQYIADLGKRGVILGICSKNELKNVVEVFERHQHMPLNLNDFASVYCNWEDKASNLASIALDLNIDPTAIVFVDDNPAECELVRKTLPTVQVIQLDSDPSTFIRRLDRERLFDSQFFSDADVGRARSYTARIQAKSLRSTATDLSSYLNSLQMIGQVCVAGPDDLSRLAQMEAKTNQFNLTTRRWTSAKLSEFMVQMNHEVICFRMKDCFTDHGLVGSMVLRYDDDEIKILSWILSCRVFSRTCEEFMFLFLISLAKQRRSSKIIGEIILTEKNKIFRDLYNRLGFLSYQPEGFFVYEMRRAVSPITYIS